MNIHNWMLRKGITVKDLLFATFAIVPLMIFTSLLMLGLIGGLLT